MRADQLLPVQPGEGRDDYARRMVDEFRLDVPRAELVLCAKMWWDTRDRMLKKEKILQRLDCAVSVGELRNILIRMVRELL